MKSNKKGADAATSTPRIEKSMTVQSHLNIIKNTCLLLISAFLILAWVGTVTGNDAITILGLGLGASGGLILARLNLKEDE